MSRERILIAGCGDLGTELGLQLADAGHEVWGLRRRAEPLPSPLHSLRADLTDPVSLERVVPAELDLVFYIATPGAFNDEAYRRAYPEGLQNLLNALDDQAPRRLILVSSTSVYGQENGEWVDEESPTQPAGFSGQRMLEAEHIAMASSIATTVVRFAGIYGPGRTRLLNKVRNNEPCIADQYSNRIHRTDCIGILAHLARPDVAAGIYLAADDTPCAQCELMDWLADRLDVPQPPRADKTQRRRGGSKRCRNEKLKASGYELRYPSYREGYAAMLD